MTRPLHSKAAWEALGYHLVAHSLRQHPVVPDICIRYFEHSVLHAAGNGGLLGKLLLGLDDSSSIWLSAFTSTITNEGSSDPAATL